MDKTVGKSRFWEPLWEYYSKAPSIALCRIPELEYASGLAVADRFLDHCCGDGRFASLAWPGSRLSAGCDINSGSIEKARSFKIYERLDHSDASKQLPYADKSFRLIFNNSALEHIADLTGAVKEIKRVLAPDGIFAFNVLNHRYFEWWPLGEAAQNGYRQWQPFYHALNLEEWEVCLSAAGPKVVSVDGYFDKEATQELGFLDYFFSGYYIARLKSAYVWWYLNTPIFPKAYCRRRLSRLIWRTDPDHGSGYFIQAVHA